MRCPKTAVNTAVMMCTVDALCSGTDRRPRLGEEGEGRQQIPTKGRRGEGE